jgi:hypothetical protein
MHAKYLFAPLLALMAWGALQPAFAAEDDWKEVEAPPPPAYSKNDLIALNMPVNTALKFGIDPASLSIGSDDVLRYVMVAYAASGSTNALYEGLRCATGEIKTYARSTEPGRWNVAKEPEWRALDARDAATRHAVILARQGACEGRVLAAQKVPDMIRLLRNPKANTGF